LEQIFGEVMPNKQQDDNNNWRWPLTFMGGGREDDGSEVSRPLRHAAWLAFLLALGLALLLVEGALIGRALPLLLVAGAFLWCAWPALFAGSLPTGARLALAFAVAVLLGAWLFFVGPRLLNRLWFPIWYSWDTDWFYVYTNILGARRLPLWTLWLRLAVIVALPLLYYPAALVIVRFRQEIVLPGLSRLRPFPIDIGALRWWPFNQFATPDEEAPDDTSRAVIMGPDLDPHTWRTPGESTARSNGGGQSWRREIIALGLRDEQWAEIARRALGGLGWTDAERLPGVALHDWRKLRQALARVQWLENPTGRRYELTDYGREQFERIAAGDYSPLGR